MVSKSTEGIAYLHSRWLCYFIGFINKLSRLSEKITSPPPFFFKSQDKNKENWTLIKTFRAKTRDSGIDFNSTVASSEHFELPLPCQSTGGV